VKYSITLRRQQRRRLEREAAREREAERKQRIRIVLCIGKGLAVTLVHETCGAARSTIYRVARRFLEDGESAFESHRREVPPRKLTEEYAERLEQLITTNPRELGWQRSTWTSELLSRQLKQEMGICFHPTHVRRLLRLLDVRWGRPRPVPPRWARWRKRSRAEKIQRRIKRLARDEVAVYADEVDVHLNPKIGPCWMAKNTQTEVETPGQNEKRYVFGGLNPRTGFLVWMASEKKNSAVFIDWLRWLSKSYRPYRVIHVVCDNYIIHKSRATLAALATLGRIVMHYLPPYAPEYNPIERLWGELHANVTRNHRCRTMAELMEQVTAFLDAVVPYPGARPAYAAARV
jgi:transposase